MIYEIYLRSLQDSNGDGVGDLNGITQRLDYLQEWALTPSGFHRCTHRRRSISGMTSPIKRTWTRSTAHSQTFDHLVADAKKRKIRIIFDMVLNHISDKHKWFIESESSRTSPKHDWYAWNDGKPGPGQTRATASCPE
jgi:alpha-glucosidase